MRALRNASIAGQYLDDNSSPSKTAVIMANVSAIVTILTPVATVIAIVISDSASVPATILAVYVCALTTFLLFLLFRQELRSHRDAHYGPATVPLRLAFTDLARASWTMVQTDGSKDLFLEYLKMSLRNLARAFSLITDHDCRVSIKIISAGAQSANDIHDLKISTLCRSNEGQEPDRTNPDRIEGNTDFKKIFVDKVDFFFSNDLLKERDNGYENSHWDDEVFRNKSFEYLATIVWPISRPQSEATQSAQHREVIGFLCVDTHKTDVFHRMYDTSIGTAFAQALYLAIQRYRTKQEQAEATTATS